MILDFNVPSLTFYHSISLDGALKKVRTMKIKASSKYWVVSTFGADRMCVSIVGCEELDGTGDLGGDAISSGGGGGGGKKGAVAAKSLMVPVPLEAKESEKEPEATPIDANGGGGSGDGDGVSNATTESKAEKKNVEKSLTGDAAGGTAGGTAARKYSTMAPCFSVGVDVMGNNNTYGVNSNHSSFLHSWSNQSPQRVWWNDAVSKITNDGLKDCNPVHIYHSYAGTSGSVLTPGTAALSLMAALDLVTSSSVNNPEPSLASRLKQQKEEIKMKQQKKKKKKKKKKKMKQETIAITPTKDTMNVMMDMLVELQLRFETLKETDTTTVQGLIMTLRLMACHIRAMASTSLYDLNPFRDLLRNIMKQVQRVGAAGGAAGVGVGYLRTLTETATDCFNTSVPLLYRDALSRTNLLLSVMSNQEEKQQEEEDANPDMIFSSSPGRVANGKKSLDTVDCCSNFFFKTLSNSFKLFCLLFVQR